MCVCVVSEVCNCGPVCLTPCVYRRLCLRGVCSCVCVAMCFL